MVKVGPSIPAWSYKVQTPDGTMFVHILEEKGKPVGVLINIGKVGHALAAWSSALASTITLALRQGVSIHDVLAEISGITTDRRTPNSNGVFIRSGPEGVAFAIMKYLRRNQPVEKEHDDEHRPARFRYTSPD